MKWNPVKLVQDWLDSRREKQAAENAQKLLKHPHAER